MTFDASSNVKSDSTDTIVTVGGNPETAADLPYTTDWINSGTTLSWSFSSPVASSSSPSDTHYNWDSTSGLGQTGQSGVLTVTASGTVIGNYETQHVPYIVGGEIIDTPTPFNYLIMTAIATVAIASIALLLRRVLSSRFPRSL